MNDILDCWNTALSGFNRRTNCVVPFPRSVAGIQQAFERAQTALADSFTDTASKEIIYDMAVIAAAQQGKWAAGNSRAWYCAVFELTLKGHETREISEHGFYQCKALALEGHPESKLYLTTYFKHVFQGA